MSEEITKSQIDRIERLQYRQLAATFLAMALVAATQTTVFTPGEWNGVAVYSALFAAVAFALYTVMWAKDGLQLNIRGILGRGKAE